MAAPAARGAVNFFFFRGRGGRTCRTVRSAKCFSHHATNLIVELSWPAPANGHGPHLTSLMATEASWATVISSWFAARACAGRASRRWKKSKFFLMTGLVSHRQASVTRPLASQPS